MPLPGSDGGAPSETDGRATPHLHGVLPAIISDVDDPDGLGRVRVGLPWAGEPDAYQAWARLATLAAGAGHGTWFVPSVGDEVLVAFEAGDARRPYVLGALWNVAAPPPARQAGCDADEVSMIRTRTGISITLEDHDGGTRLELATPGGARLTLDDGGTAVVLSDGDGNEVRLDAGTITVRSAASISIEAAGQVSVRAPTVQVQTPMARFSGILQAETLIAQSVVASSYTPGAGNIW